MRNFEHNDVLVPRKHLREWMKYAIIVDEVAGDGTLYAFAMGGGFRLRFDPVRVETYDFIKVPQDKLENPGWHSTDVYAEWTDKKYRAWTTGKLWNGWAMPFFEFEEAKRYAQDAGNTVYDHKQDAFVTTMEGQDELEVDAATVIHVRGRREPIKVYPIGAGSWTWESAREEEEEDDLGGMPSQPTMGISSLQAQFGSPQVSMTPGAKAAFEKSGEQPAKYLDRHFSGDFGEVTGDDAALNQGNIASTGMVMSIYTLSTGVRFYVITDDGHLITTLLLPSEY